MSGKAEPIIFQQEGPAHKCRLIDAPWRFDTSVVPPELRDIPFELRLQEFEEQLHVEIYYKPVGGVAKQYSPVRIVDISEDHQVRIGLSWHSQNGVNYSALASAIFNAKQATWLLQRWQKLYEDKCHKADCEAAIREARLDQKSVSLRREEVLNTQRLDSESIQARRETVMREAGLDKKTVETKRADALKKAGLDDESLETARELVRQRLRVEKESIPPPSSKTN